MRFAKISLLLAAVTAAVTAVGAPATAAPKVDWYPCGFSGLPYGECGTLRVPLDYTNPRRGTTELSVFRVRAAKPRSRIGSLFIGPDQVGASALGTASLYAFNPNWPLLGQEVHDRFDLVTFDPRGTAFSDNVACFKTEREQLAALKGLSPEVPPTTAAGQKALVASARALGKACATTGKPLAGSMSTAQTARDMDTLRGALGDPKLSYVGIGYGSVVGQYYANMFPSRVRALALDSVYDSVAWTGTGAAAGKPIYDRLRVVDARYGDMRELLARCAVVGAERCKMAAGGGNPTAKYDTMIARIKAKPIVLPPTDDGNPAATFTYADWLWIVNYGMVMGGTGGAVLVDLAADLYNASGTPARTATKAAAETYHRLRAKAVSAGPVGFGYDNTSEAASATVCTDGRYPARSAQWPGMVTGLGRRAGEFAPYAWAYAQCAADLWKVRDTSAYTGPFNRRTSAPLLVVGVKHGWTANYDDAVTVSRRMPGSRLITSDSWGLAGLGSSSCMTAAADAYLLKGVLPKAGTVCLGDDQPYAD